MQNTLLGLGIALILALVTALAGPLFVDWGRYRAGFEQEASRMAGLPVRIGGAIDVRLLPTPTIVVHDIEVGSRAAPVFGAQSARAELALGSLMRGEWRAAVLTLEAPDIGLGLDADGRIVSRNVAPGIDLDRFSIDQIVVRNGTLSLDDAGSRARVTLEQLSFDGEMRSLAGALKGDGMFAAGGEHYKFRISTGRSEGALRVHMNLDAQDRPLSFETDGTLAFDGGVPRYEGSLTALRPAGVQLDNGRTVASDPWRVAAKLKADVHGALMEQIEVQYGPDERVVRMNGSAEMKFGASPALNGVLSARQVDIDRALGQSDATNRLPLAALRSLTLSFGELGRPPMPVHLGIGADSVTLSGSTLQTVRGDLNFSGDVWSVENFEFRAPGLTQVALAGRFTAAQDGAEFSGPMSVDSADPRALLAWLEGFERVRAALAPLKLRGDITAGRSRLMIDKVHAEADRRTYEGRLAYTFPAANRPAKLDAALTASEFDLDGAIAFFKAAIAGTSFERPGEIALAIDLGRTKLAGIAASSVNARVHVDGAGVRIEKLAVGDFGGAAMDASGQIDISASPPRGEIKLSVGAQKLDGIAALVRPFSPSAADALTRYASALAPASLQSSIRVDPPSNGERGAALGRIAVNGRLGSLQVNVSGDVAGSPDKWSDGKVKLTAQVGSDDGALLRLLGFDRVLGASARPGSLTLALDGPMGGELGVRSGLKAAGLEAGAEGKLKLFGGPVSGAFDATMTAMDLPGLKRVAAALPLTLKSHVKIADGALAFEGLAGKIGGADVSGRIVRQADGRFDGHLDMGSIDAAAVGAAVTGIPLSQKLGSWSAQPFAGGPLAGLSGKIALAAAQANLLPALKAEHLRGTLSFSPAEVKFDGVTGSVGGGALAMNMSFKSGPGGMTAGGAIKLTDADAAPFIPVTGDISARGRLSAQAEFEGAGATPASLVGALRGTGTVTLEKAQLPSLDDKAIGVAIRAVERGTPVTAPRISEVVTRAMDDGSYTISRIVAPFEIAAGRVRLGKVTAPPRGGDLAIAGSLDLVDETLDARLILSGAAPDGTGKERPAVSVALKGPLRAPQRTIDVSPLVGWLTLQAVDREAKKLEEAEREARRRERIRAELEERLRRTAPQPETAPSATASPAPTAPPIESAPLAPITR